MTSALSVSTLSLNGTKQRPSNNKEPRPERTLMVTAAIVQGIREAILLTEEDISTLKNSLHDHLSLQTQQQQKAAERYLKRLDYYLSALEELQEAYNVQNRLREGVRAMGKAYIESLGPERDSALANVRSGFKECNEVMCSLEGQLEPRLGVLHIQMKGLQGFARLCPGDVFEITLRHGSQKWRTKGKIGRDGSQTWDSAKFTFKVMIDELLFIRAIEVRSLGKQLLLGNKYCETLDLFCAQPQMMTVNLNASGSVKLNLVVTWDPLDGAAEEKGASMRRPERLSSSSIHSQLGTMSSITHGSITALSVASYGSEGTTSPDHDSGQSSTLNSTGVASEFHDYVARQRRNERNGKTTPPDDAPADAPPTPDYSSDSAGSHESLAIADPEEIPPAPSQPPTPPPSQKNAGAGESLSKARSDTSGNFLLVRRIEGSASGASPGVGGANWWQQQKYYSSPTHTVDSGYGDVAKRQHPTVSDVFTEEDEQQQVEAKTGTVTSGRHFRSTNNAWLTPDLGRSAPLRTADSVDDEWDNVDDDLTSPQPPEEEEEEQTRPEELKEEVDASPASMSSTSCWTDIVCDLDEALEYLSNVIDDCQGQYPQLELFERSVTSLYQLYKVQSDQTTSQTSMSSLTIDNVLECFDFLDNEESEPNEMTTSWNGRPKSPPPPPPLRPPPPPPPSVRKIVFTQQLDNTLLIHLKYCQHLISDLGSFGPLKCRERRSLSQLQVQGRILNKLAKLIEKWQRDPCVKLSIIEELNGLPHLQKLWGAICAGSRSLSVPNEDAFHRLLPLCKNNLLYSPHDIQEKVLKQLLARCQDTADYNPQLNLTVFQFRYFVRSKECSFQARLDEINDEMQIISALQSTNTQYIDKTMARLRLMGQVLPGQKILMEMSHLLLPGPFDGRQSVVDFLTNYVNDVDLKHQMIDSFVEGLESNDTKDRQGSCEVLAILQDSSVVSRLAYIAQSDPSSQVRKQAKRALDTLGEDGRDALQQLQLSSHGFQGISVK